MQPKAAKKKYQATHTNTHQRKTKSSAFSPALDLSLFSLFFCYGHERELTDEADIP